MFKPHFHYHHNERKDFKVNGKLPRSHMQTSNYNCAYSQLSHQIGATASKSSASTSSVSWCRNTALVAKLCHYCFNFPILSRENYFWQRVANSHLRTCLFANPCVLCCACQSSTYIIVKSFKFNLPLHWILQHGATWQILPTLIKNRKKKKKEGSKP